MNKKTNKKAGLESKWFVVLFSILFIAIAIYFTHNSIAMAKDSVEKKAPIISYQFPMVMLQSFQNTKIDAIDLESITDYSIDKSKNYYVRDILQIDSIKAKEVLKKYEDEFLEYILKKDTNSEKSIIDYYEEFSGNSFDKSDLIKIYYKQGNDLPPLEMNIEDQNYLFYYKTISNNQANSNEYVVISFKDLKYVSSYNTNNGGSSGTGAVTGDDNLNGP